MATKKNTKPGKFPKPQADASGGGGGEGLEWRLDNVAHTNTFAYLLMREDLIGNFQSVKDVSVSTLRYWNKAGPVETEARGLAARLDAKFHDELLAAYETGFAFAKAVNLLSAMLAKTETTICQLGNKIDEVYSFLGESK